MATARKVASPWTKQIAKLPAWVNKTMLSEACGLHRQYLEQVGRGVCVLDSKQAKRVIRELTALEKVVKYRQGELF